MQYTLKELANVFKVVKEANDNFNKLPFDLDAAVSSKISAEEREDYRDEFRRIWNIATIRQTPENIVDFLKLHEDRLVRYTRTLRDDELIRMHPVEKLKPKDIAILRDLGLTILAGVLERGMPIKYASPQQPAIKAQGAAPSEPAP